MEQVHPPLRVLHVVNHDQQRGAENVAVSLARGLESPEVTNRVVALGPTPSDSPPLGVQRLSEDRALTFRRLAQRTRRLRQLVKEERPDVVLAHGGQACLHAVLATRVPVVWHRILELPEFGGAQRVLWSFVARRATAAIAITDRLQHELSALGHRGPVLRVPNARSGGPYQQLDHVTQRQALAEELDLDVAGPILGFVGHMVDQKDPLLALNVFEIAGRTMPHASFLFAGEGPLSVPLKAAVKHSSVASRVHILGHRSDVPSLLSGLDCLVITSRSESMAGVSVEAALAGCPVITCDFDGAAEVIVPGKNGVIVSDRDALRIASEVVHFLDDTDRRAHCRVEASTIGQRFDLDRHLSTYRTFLRAQATSHPEKQAEPDHEAPLPNLSGPVVGRVSRWARVVLNLLRRPGRFGIARRFHFLSFKRQVLRALHVTAFACADCHRWTRRLGAPHIRALLLSQSSTTSPYLHDIVPALPDAWVVQRAGFFDGTQQCANSRKPLPEWVARMMAWDVVITADHTHHFPSATRVIRITHGLLDMKNAGGDYKHHPRKTVTQAGRDIYSIMCEASDIEAQRVLSRWPHLARSLRVVGSPALDEIRDRDRLRYRRDNGLGLQDVALMVCSTFGPDSIWSGHRQLLRQCIDELPSPPFRIVVTIHPRILQKLTSSEAADLASLRRALELKGGIWAGADWRTASTIADVVVSDHTSVGASTAALGIPTLFVKTAGRNVRPDSPYSDVIRHSMHVSDEGPLAEQMDAAMRKQPPPEASTLWSYQGQSLARFREVLDEEFDDADPS